MESATNHPTAPTTHDLGGRFSGGGGGSARDRLRALPLPRPELAALVALVGVLYLWALGRNGFANDYYSAAVRSMSGSWHNFLFGSFDAGGLMTVDKPPLALWVQALSVKAFGFNSLAILAPQALMGMASVGLVYDLTRRRWGRAAGTVAGLALALTPVMVAVSRHNNPDALLVLCSVGALWCFVRALERGSTKWLVLAGVAVGLGFEAKMGAALMVVPGMALAWLWVAPRGRAAAARQLAVAGAAMLAVALAWPVLVWLTPASSRPWVSGTSDNSIWSLIWEYNGFGRLEGQTGGPGGGIGGGGFFGGETGALRLLNEALGGQAGWTLGLGVVGGIGIAALSRLRRTDPRTGWILAVGGAFAVTAVAFSFAGGIFHPYYVSLLAPFAAALVGATFAQARSAGLAGRRLGALALGAGAVTELVVIRSSAGELGWLVAPIVIATIAAALVLLLDPATLLRHRRAAAEGERPADARLDRARSWLGVGDRRVTVALAGALAVLAIAPAIWSVDTLGYATSGTFPAGGPASASSIGPGGTGGGPSGMSGGPGGMTGGPGGAAGGLGGSTGGAPGGGMPGAGTLPGGGESSEEMRQGPGSEAPEGLGGGEGIEGLGGPPGSGGSLGREGFPGGPGAELGTEGFPGSQGAELGTEGFPGSQGAELGTEGFPGSQGAELGTEGFPGAQGAEGLPDSRGAGSGTEGLPGSLGAESGEASGGAVSPFGESSAGGAGAFAGPGGAMGGGMFGGQDLAAVVEYTEAHGGGTIAVGSQSEAAASIIESGAEVAGIGGFSGKESTVSVEWLEDEIAAGNVGWILTGGGMAGGPGGGLGGDTREGSESAIRTVVKTCEAVPASEYEGSATSASTQILYRCGS